MTAPLDLAEILQGTLETEKQTLATFSLMIEFHSY